MAHYKSLINIMQLKIGYNIKNISKLEYFNKRQIELVYIKIF